MDAIQITQMILCPDIRCKKTGKVYTFLSINKDRNPVFTPVGGDGDSRVVVSLDGYEVVKRKR